MKGIALFIFLLSSNKLLFAQNVIPLYVDSICNSIVDLEGSEIPTLTTYILPKEKSTGTAVIIFPGGAYSFLATSTEGTPIAKAFIEKGISAFVVKYRLPSDETMRDKSLGPLMDAQQAMKVVRQYAKEWNIDSNKIGIIGFSAGGHLASMLGTHFSINYIPNSGNNNLRPNFMILVYSVISMDNALTHRGSRINLLGDYPSMDKVKFFSGEEQVTKYTPPTYLTHCADDGVVNVQNSIEMYNALLQKKVPAELHLFPKGNHGFTQRLPVDEWLYPMLMFLKREGIYKAVSTN